MNTKPTVANRFALPIAFFAIAILLVALLLQSFSQSAAPAKAQAATPASNTNSNTISVTAQGSASAQPDLAIINLGVQAQASTAREAVDKHNAQLATVLAKLKELGIAEADTQTTSFNIYPEYGSDNRQVQSYTASSNLTIKVQDITRTGTLLDALVTAGANTASGVSFTLKDTQQLEAAALANAVANARPKAEAIAKQLGVSISGISTVVEGSNTSPSPIMYDKAMATNSSIPVAPGQLTTTASVSVVFTYSK